MSYSIRLFYADDHALIRDTLADRFDREPGIEVVGIGVDAEEVVTMVRQLKPDIVLLDIDMPGLSCFDAAQRATAISPKTDIIFLSSYSHDHYIDMALRVKAKGYLTKNEPFSVLVKAIRRVAAGRTHFSPSVESRIIADKNGIRLSGASRKTRASILSPREVEVLQYITNGISKKKIAELMHVSIKTVDTHAQRLMDKLNIHNRVELTHFAIREKLIEV